MILSNDDIFDPSLEAVTSKTDLEFFVPSLNSVLGSEILWLPDNYDWIKSENSVALMVGGNPAAGLFSGEKSKIYFEGLEKTALTTSDSLELQADNGNFTLVYDAKQTHDILITASTSNAQLINLAEEPIQADAFSVEGKFLKYETSQSRILFELDSASEVTLISKNESETILIKQQGGEFQITTGSIEEPLLLTNSSAASELNSTENYLSVGNEDPLLNDQLQTTMLSDTMFSNDDVDIYSSTARFYDEQNYSDVSLTEDMLEILSSYKTEQGINEILSRVDDDIIFDISPETTVAYEFEFQQFSEINQNHLDRALNFESFSDLVFDDSLDFYYEI